MTRASHKATLAESDKQTCDAAVRAANRGLALSIASGILGVGWGYYLFHSGYSIDDDLWLAVLIAFVVWVSFALAYRHRRRAVTRARDAQDAYERAIEARESARVARQALKQAETTTEAES